MMEKPFFTKCSGGSRCPLARFCERALLLGYPQQAEPLKNFYIEGRSECEHLILRKEKKDAEGSR